MFYGKGYCCPPDTPTAEETQAVVDCYTRCILLHIEAPKSDEQNKIIGDFVKMCVELELEVFKDGYHKAFVYLAGPCLDCKECGKQTGESCRFPLKARPAMEACGIDVYQTARNNGLPIQTLKTPKETQNKYCLLLVE
jgi:predicted metal-binding protein